MTNIHPGALEQIYKCASINLSPNTMGQVCVRRWCGAGGARRASPGLGSIMAPPLPDVMACARRLPCRCWSTRPSRATPRTSSTTASAPASWPACAGERAPAQGWRAVGAACVSRPDLERARRRARLVTDGFNALEGVTCNFTEGAMYSFPQVRRHRQAPERSSLTRWSCGGMYSKAHHSGPHLACESHKCLLHAWRLPPRCRRSGCPPRPLRRRAPPARRPTSSTASGCSRPRASARCAPVEGKHTCLTALLRLCCSPSLRVVLANVVRRAGARQRLWAGGGHVPPAHHHLAAGGGDAGLCVQVQGLPRGVRQAAQVVVRLRWLGCAGIVLSCLHTSTATRNTHSGWMNDQRLSLRQDAACCPRRWPHQRRRSARRREL